ncbi:UNVERIFIED_CONTAM: hypothetical protein HDU68_009448 [Siphonaria sp. JEL0065]|nr:hypothetical protein HDU68_009448 [Siphonaria sp. JEL0065]
MPITSFRFLGGGSSQCSNVMYLLHSMDATCSPVSCGTNSWSFPEATEKECPSDWKAHGRSVFQPQNVEFVEIGRYQDTSCTVPWASGIIGEHYATNKCIPVSFGQVAYYLVTVSSNQKQVTWSSFSTSDCSGTPMAISLFNVGGCTTNAPPQFQQSVTLFPASSPPQPQPNPVSSSPLPASQVQSSTSPLQSKTATGQSSATSTQQPNGSSTNGSNGVVIGGTVAAILVIGLGIGAFVYSRHRKSNDADEKNSNYPLSAVYNHHPPSYEPTPDFGPVHSESEKAAFDSGLSRFPENPPSFAPPKPVYSVTAVPGFYRALSDHFAENDAQLTLKEGQRLYITSMPNADGWCKGLVGNGEGWVHASLLEVIG